MLPPDHADRRVLADEVHARPPETLDAPCRVTYLAALIDPGDRPRELAHIALLCEAHGVAGPPAGATHFSGWFGPVRFRWERHGEFSGFTIVVPGASETPFADPVAAHLPDGWLAAVPGRTLVATHAYLVRTDAQPWDVARVAPYFDGNLVVGGDIGDGAGMAFTDFRIHADGFGRFVVCNRHMTERQAGRTVQRLFEIEAYRMLALLALPVARALAPRIAGIERSLGEWTTRISVGSGGDEDVLHELTRLAAEIENCLVATQFRFDACRAYHGLVTTRIGELREARLPGVQPIAEFMARRLTPAMATCATTAQRLSKLSERAAHASALLSTRVDIARERQNQALLASMDRRAKLQLRLQHTVEGLSVAAIVYYVVGLLAYLAKAGKSGGLPIQPDLLVGLAVPCVGVVVAVALRRARKKMYQAD